MRLSERDRERTTILSAILRVADALDRAHLQSVSYVGITVSKGEMILQMEGEGDLLLERWAVTRKAALLAKTFDRDFSFSV
jgi:exopolyphosphatase/guanosine-5'-triphosphate,3'-diphosphate pyrophosphatase